MRFPLDWLLLDRWYWITILGCFAVVIGPLIMIYIIIFLPAPLRAVAVFGIIVGWSLAGGYKDWIKAKRKEGKLKPGQFRRANDQMIAQSESNAALPVSLVE